MRELLFKAVLCVAFLLPGVALAQEATITGTVTDDEGQPLIGAQVVIESMTIGSATDIDGRYRFIVPANRVRGQQVTLVARYVGFSPIMRDVTLSAGAMTQDFTLNPDLLNLDEVVVTGVTEATPQKKLSFTVAKVGGDQLEMAPATSPVGSMQGKVAGASVVSNSGQPGSGFSVRLRGSTSITGSSEPLYIVDGVILSGDQVDMGALDIESLEIVKGAAASSLYGSRAQNGVIQITTKRGSQIPLDNTRITVRNEFGVSSLQDNFEANSAHNLKVNAQGQFLNADGNVNACSSCLANGYGPGTLEDKILGGVSFYDKKYQGETFNAFDEFFSPGNTYTNYVSVSQNSLRTNFHASFTNLHQDGVVDGINGFDQRGFRMNLDHKAFDNLSLSATAFYSQSSSDDVLNSDGGQNINPFFGLMFTNPLVNLNRRNENGELIVKADPLAVEENPIYTIRNIDVTNDRSRVLGNFRARYSPVEWLDVEGSMSYDRLDKDGLEFYNRGFETIDPAALNEGRIERRNAIFEALNADVTASLRRRFGDLTARSQFKYQLERTDAFSQFVSGNDLATLNIKDFDNVEGTEKIISNSASTIRADGVYATAGIDYDDKYIADFLLRRDGSSLFGSEERWQTYYRVSAAYRVSEEAWWPIKDAVDEFKLRYSLGTAGGRPCFECQYETFTLSDGTLGKGTLGNKFLKPELQTEQEFGLEMSFLDRFFLEAVYADSKVEDQLLRVPLAGYFGFGAQWQNAGVLTSNTIEATLNANILRSRSTSLDLGIVFDRTRQEISEFNSNAFLGGPQTAFYIREGETLGAMYGKRWLTKTSELPAGADASAWQKNDDGYLVPVGPGNTYRDGFAKELWGKTVDTNGDGVGDRLFGMPVAYVDPETGRAFAKIGNVLPDFNLGFNSTFRYRGMHVYMLWNAQVGGDVYNFTKQWAYRDGRHIDQDQSDKAQDQRKPINYYEALYQATDINSHYVEDGTYVKLRELSLGYTFDRAKLQGLFGNALNQVSVSVIGRNLLTFTNYSGFDPEVGDNGSSGSVGGDASLFRVDDFNYPHFRTFTGKLEIQF